MHDNDPEVRHVLHDSLPNLLLTLTCICGALRLWSARSTGISRDRSTTGQVQNMRLDGTKPWPVHPKQQSRYDLPGHGRSRVALTLGVKADQDHTNPAELTAETIELVSRKHSDPDNSTDHLSAHYRKDEVSGPLRDALGRATAAAQTVLGGGADEVYSVREKKVVKEQGFKTGVGHEWPTTSEEDVRSAYPVCCTDALEADADLLSSLQIKADRGDPIY